ncbi:MAG: type VI secretion system Vgr family protein [Gemmataceae bacterium]
MPPSTPSNLPLKLVTKPDSALRPVHFAGKESISELFRFEVDVLADRKTSVPFAELIGQEAHLELRLEATRSFHGIITEISEGDSDESFTSYRLVLAPALWRLTKRAGFRIFQDQSVLVIARTLLAGLTFRVQTVGTYQKRNFTVQYGETDFAFLSRLLEQEGIYYFFEHSAEEHTLVLSDQSTIQRDIPAPSELRYDQSKHARFDARVSSWRKSQALCSGKFTHWDYNFHMPEKRLEAARKIPDRVTVGSVEHRLDVGANEELDVFRFTGGYGALQDSLSVTGRPREQDLQLLFKESEDFARLSMEREACASLHVAGSSTCARFLPGHHFSLSGHAHADGAYLLTAVVHQLRQTGWRSGEQESFEYSNDFTALPKDLPYRPLRRTPWPKASGLQPAIVVGPKDSELFTDEFGRVKVQFLWDRLGKYDPGSSCWIRVAQAHAGNGFGFLSIPRIGEEVLVGFAADNPDRPYIVGSVYNPRHPPPFQLPEAASRTVLKSHSLRGDEYQFSGLAIEDQIGKEHVHLHSERDMIVSAENNHVVSVLSQHHLNVGHVHLQSVGTPLKPAGGSGSGSGSGDHGKAGSAAAALKADLQAHAGNQVDYQGPFDWSTNEGSCQLGYYFSMVYGYNGDRTCGLLNEHVLGAHVEIMVNPLGFLGNLGGSVLGGPLAGTVSSLMGHVEFVLASHTELVYGSILEGHRGCNATMNGEPSSLTRALAVVTALVESADYMVFGLLNPDDRGYYVTSGVVGGVNALLEVGIVLSELLKFGEKTVEIVTEQMEAEEAVEKETGVSEQLLALYQAILKVGDTANTASQQSAKLATEKISRVEVTDSAQAIWARDIALCGTQAVQISNGEPNVGVLSLNQESFKIAFSEFGSITLDAAGLTVAFGIPDEGPTIRLNEAGIQLTVGDTRIALNAATGIVLETGDTSIVLSPEAGIEQAFGATSVSITEVGISLTCAENEFLVAPAGFTIVALMMELFVSAVFLLSAATSTTLGG